MDTTQIDIVRLKTIIFFDSLGFGIMYPHICPHILDIQGNQLYVGVFGALNLICSLISEDVTKWFLEFKGKKFAAYIILMMSISSHLCIVMTNYITFIMFCRLVFTLTNEASSFCKAMLLKIIPVEEHEKEIINLSLLSSTGLILGPIIGGIIFSVPGGFTLISLVTAAITFGNVLLLLKVRCAEEHYKPEGPFKHDIIISCKAILKEYVDDFHHSDYHETWSFPLVQFIFLSGWTIYYLKFPQILYSNFNVGSITYGFAAGFTNMLMIGSATLMPALKKRYIDKYPISMKIEISLVTNLVCLMLMCHSQIFILYWLLLIPFVFTKTLVTSFWSDMYRYCGNERILNLIPAINILAGILTPIGYGVICNVLCPNIVKTWACFSILTAYLLFILYIKPFFN